MQLHFKRMAKPSFWTRCLEASIKDMFPKAYVDASTTNFIFVSWFSWFHFPLVPPQKSENVSAEWLFLQEKQGWVACCLPWLSKLLLPCWSYQAQHQPADMASVNNQTGLPVGLALARSHHGIVLGVFRVTGPTLPQVALWGPWKDFFAINDGVQQCAGLFLVVLERLARGRTKPANLLPEGSCKLLSLPAFLSWKEQALSLSAFLSSLCRR